MTASRACEAHACQHQCPAMGPGTSRRTVGCWSCWPGGEWEVQGVSARPPLGQGKRVNPLARVSRVAGSTSSRVRTTRSTICTCTGIAFSGTPTDPSLASANPGQIVTLNGSGLSSTTDVLLQYVESGGAATQWVL